MGYDSIAEPSSPLGLGFKLQSCFSPPPSSHRTTEHPPLVADHPMRAHSCLEPPSSDANNGSSQHCSHVVDRSTQPRSDAAECVLPLHSPSISHPHVDGRPAAEHPPSNPLSSNVDEDTSSTLFGELDLSNTDLALSCPRISFSLDDLISEHEDEQQHRLIESTTGACVERRKWRVGSLSGDENDEFEFSSKETSGCGHLVSSAAQTSMLPADMLFSDGKLIPLGCHQRAWSLPSSSSSCSPSQAVHESHVSMKTEGQEKQSLARHASFDISRHSPLPLSLKSSKTSCSPCPSADKFIYSSSQRILSSFQCPSSTTTHLVKTEPETLTSTSSSSWRMHFNPRFPWPFSRSNSSRLHKHSKYIPNVHSKRNTNLNSSFPSYSNIRWTPTKIYTTNGEENTIPWEGPRVRRGVEAKICRETMGAKKLYPITVSPVLNMGMYRGTTSKCRGFRLVNLFSWRKHDKKFEEKP